MVSYGFSDGFPITSRGEPRASSPLSRLVGRPGRIWETWRPAGGDPWRPFRLTGKTGENTYHPNINNTYINIVMSWFSCIFFKNKTIIVLIISWIKFISHMTIVNTFGVIMTNSNNYWTYFLLSGWIINDILSNNTTTMLLITNTNSNHFGQM